jgi:opacity protein-like surface antigen
MSDYGFSYGAGLQFNPIENVALDFSYEQSRIVDARPVVQTVSRTSGDAVVLTFVVSTVAGVVFFGVGT